MNAWNLHSDLIIISRRLAQKKQESSRHTCRLSTTPTDMPDKEAVEAKETMIPLYNINGTLSAPTLSRILVFGALYSLRSFCPPRRYYKLFASKQILTIIQERATTTPQQRKHSNSDF